MCLYQKAKFEKLARRTAKGPRTVATDEGHLLCNAASVNQLQTADEAHGWSPLFAISKGLVAVLHMRHLRSCFVTERTDQRLVDRIAKVDGTINTQEAVPFRALEDTASTHVHADEMRSWVLSTRETTHACVHVL